MYIHVNYYRGPFLFTHFFSYLYILIWFIISQIFIQQIHKPSVSLAVSVSELQSESDARSNITGL